MSDATIYGGLSLTIPEGFHVMDVAELKRAYMDDNKDRWGIADKDRHIMVAVFWHESGGLVSALATDLLSPRAETNPPDSCQNTATANRWRGPTRRGYPAD